MTLSELLAAYVDDGGDVDQELRDLVERWEAGNTPEPTDENPEPVREWPDGVEPLTGDELVALQEGLRALGGRDDVALPLVNAAADVVTETNAELDTREAVAEREEAELAAARARLNGETAEDSDTEPDTGDEGDDDPDPDGDEGDEPAGDEQPAEGAQEPEPVTASGRRAPLGSMARRPAGRRATPRGRSANDEVSDIRFASGVQGFSPGDRAPDLQAVNRAITERLDAFRGSARPPAGTREKIRVASVHARYPAERRLTDDNGLFLSPDLATQRVAEVYRQGLAAYRGDQRAVVAAGGFCAPFQQIYAVDVMGSTARPIRDTALTSFQAARGGVISMVPPLLGDVLPSVGIWDEADDIAALDNDGGVDDVVKTVLRITCSDPVESQVEAIFVALLYGNMLARTWSEYVNAWERLSRVAHARVAEQRLFDLIVAKSTPLSDEPTTLSGTRDLINYVARAGEGIRQRNRELAGFPMRLILPDIVPAMIQEDIRNGMIGGGNVDQAIAVARNRITTWLGTVGINVTFSPDLALMGPQGANTELANWPTKVPFALYPEGTFLHLDAGQIDLGIYRDSRLVSVNDVQTFAETFEGVHRLGHLSTAFNGEVTLCLTGATYGTVDPDGRCASYT